MNNKQINLLIEFILLFNLFHYLNQTGERPFICHYENCNKGFITKSNLKAHMCKHTGIKPFICNFENCKKTYTRKCRFKIHLRMHVYRYNEYYIII